MKNKISILVLLAILEILMVSNIGLFEYWGGKLTYESYWILPLPQDIPKDKVLAFRRGEECLEFSGIGNKEWSMYAEERWMPRESAVVEVKRWKYLDGEFVHNYVKLC